MKHNLDHRYVNNKKEYFFKRDIPDYYYQSFDTFYNLYAIQAVKSDNLDFHDKYITRKERTCRFCGLSYPDTTFKNKAHLIPFSLGNKRLLSYVECDECNSLFSKFENDINNYLGINKIRFSNKQHKLKPPRKNVTIFRKDNGLNTDFNTSNKPIKLLVEDNHLSMQFKTHSYSLLNIWKLLAKIALSSMPESETKNYSGLIKFLFDDCNYIRPSHLKELYSVYLHKTKTHINQPICFLYKKILPETRSLTHTFQIYFYNEIWQIFLPMNDVDDILYDGINKIQNHYCPPAMIPIETIQRWDEKPKLQMFYANRKIKTHNIQDVKLPLGFGIQFAEKIRFHKKYKKLANGIFLTKEVKYTGPKIEEILAKQKERGTYFGEKK